MTFHLAGMRRVARLGDLRLGSRQGHLLFFLLCGLHLLDHCHRVHRAIILHFINSFNVQATLSHFFITTVEDGDGLGEHELVWTQSILGSETIRTLLQVTIRIAHVIWLYAIRLRQFVLFPILQINMELVVAI